MVLSLKKYQQVLINRLMAIFPIYGQNCNLRAGNPYFPIQQQAGEANSSVNFHNCAI